MKELRTKIDEEKLRQRLLKEKISNFQIRSSYKSDIKEVLEDINHLINLGTELQEYQSLGVEKRYNRIYYLYYINLLLFTISNDFLEIESIKKMLVTIPLLINEEKNDLLELIKHFSENYELTKMDLKYVEKMLNCSIPRTVGKYSIELGSLQKIEVLLKDLILFSRMGIDIFNDYHSRIGCIDLHIHTISSDGYFTLEEIVKAAEFLGMKTIAITDHATLAGIDDNFKISNVVVIPGVEISTIMSGKKIHILGYGENLYCAKFEESLKHIREKWNKRFYDMLVILEKKFGLAVSRSEFLEYCHKSMYSIEDICEYLVNKKFSECKEDALSKYFKNKKESENSAYLSTNEKYIENTGSIIKLIKKFGGKAVIAHPWESGVNENDIKNCIFHGLDGIEVFHPTIDIDEQTLWSEIAINNKLKITGGSDFHGTNHPNKSVLGSGRNGNVKVNQDYYLLLFSEFNDISIAKRELKKKLNC